MRVSAEGRLRGAGDDRARRRRPRATPSRASRSPTPRRSRCASSRTSSPSCATTGLVQQPPRRRGRLLARQAARRDHPRRGHPRRRGPAGERARRAARGARLHGARAARRRSGSRCAPNIRDVLEPVTLADLVADELRPTLTCARAGSRSGSFLAHLDQVAPARARAADQQARTPRARSPPTQAARQLLGRRASSPSRLEHLRPPRAARRRSGPRPAPAPRPRPGSSAPRAARRRRAASSTRTSKPRWTIRSIIASSASSAGAVQDLEVVRADEQRAEPVDRPDEAHHELGLRMLVEVARRARSARPGRRS